jgi:phosphonoacetaldehyde hydrolase
MPSIRTAWRSRYGRDFTDDDVDAIYEEFLPLQREVLGEYSTLIPGVSQTIAICRQLGLKIGSSTGYTRELMKTVSTAAKEQGYEPDCVLCAEDAPRGRPAPYLLYEAAKRLDVYPLWNIVKVDDTPVGIQAGRNAGCWTIGVTRSGNCVGQTEHQLAAMGPDAAADLCQQADRKLRTAGAHYTVESVADIIPILIEIDVACRHGQLPIA